MKAIKTVSAVVASAAIVGINAAPAVMAWGDNSGKANGRDMYTLENCEGTGYGRTNCTVSPSMGDKVTFNSYKNGNIGDERNFVGARENTGINAGVNNVWNANEITVEDGKEYLVRLYAHNNNPNGKVAEGVTLHFTLPTEAGTELSVQGSIDSTNADPTRVYDDVVFKSADGSQFYLDYIEGSAHFENNFIGANGGYTLSDDIITSKGVLIGDSELDGQVPGCFKYASYTTIRVKAHYLNKSFKVEKTVRNVTNGEKTFSDTVDAKVGDIVEYQIYFENISGQHMDDVVVRDLLPNNMEYIDGSTKLYNQAHQQGAINNNDTIPSTGINIGSYDDGANAYIRFRAVVVDKSMVCGTNKLVNWGQVGVGKTTIQDNAFVMVKKTQGCDTIPTTPVEDLPTTGPVSIMAGALGAGGIVTAAGYVIASRKH